MIHDHYRELLLIAGVALAMSSIAVATRWSSMELPLRGGHPYVSLYDPPHTRAEALLDVGDGQAYAALARDPTLARPQVFNSSVTASPQRAEAAYRAERPLFGWMAWAGSLGRARVVPLVLMILTVLGGVVLAAGVAVAAWSLGRRGDLAPVVLALPGSLVVLAWTGPEALASGLGVLGLALWPKHRRWAVLAFTVAAFGRESMLLFPLAVAISELRRHRDSRLLAVPFLMWAGWITVVRARLGYWPTTAGGSRLGLPIVGLVQGARTWSFVGYAVLAVGVILTVAACNRLSGIWRLAALTQLGYVALLGSNVWMRWDGFSRVLLPLYVLGVIALLPGLTSPASPTGSEAVPVGSMAATS